MHCFTFHSLFLSHNLKKLPTIFHITFQLFIFRSQRFNLIHIGSLHITKYSVLILLCGSPLKFKLLNDRLKLRDLLLVEKETGLELSVIGIIIVIDRWFGVISYSRRWAFLLLVLGLLLMLILLKKRICKRVIPTNSLILFHNYTFLFVYI